MTASVLGGVSARDIKVSSPKHFKLEIKSFKSLSAFGWALMLEALLIAGGVYWMASHPVKPPVKVIPITIETTAPAIEKSTEPENSKPVQLLKPVAPPPIQPLAPPPKAALPPAPQLSVAKEAQTAVQPAVSALLAAPVVSAPVIDTSSVVPPPTIVPNPDVVKAYESRVKAAAQAALKVPGSVTALSFKGRTQVRFTLKDGVVSGLSVFQSSGLGAMDRAATQAVQSANYPVAPETMQGKDLFYEVWVTHAPEN